MKNEIPAAKQKSELKFKSESQLEKLEAKIKMAEMELKMIEREINSAVDPAQLAKLAAEHELKLKELDELYQSILE